MLDHAGVGIVLVGSGGKEIGRSASPGVEEKRVVRLRFRGPLSDTAGRHRATVHCKGRRDRRIGDHCQGLRIISAHLASFRQTVEPDAMGARGYAADGRGACRRDRSNSVAVEQDRIAIRIGIRADGRSRHRD